MGTSYLSLKLLHIFVAVVALGTSAGLGIVLELYGDDATHGSFVLRVIQRMVAWVVLPGYVVLLATGLWMANLAWPLTVRWIQFTLGLWAVGIVSLGWSLTTLAKQQRLHTSEGPASVGYRRASVTSRIAGASFALVVVAILYLMVFKPPLVTPV